MLRRMVLFCASTLLCGLVSIDFRLASATSVQQPSKSSSRHFRKSGPALSGLFTPNQQWHEGKPTFPQENAPSIYLTSCKLAAHALLSIRAAIVLVSFEPA